MKTLFILALLMTSISLAVADGGPIPMCPPSKGPHCSNPPLRDGNPTCPPGRKCNP